MGYAVPFLFLPASFISAFNLSTTTLEPWSLSFCFYFSLYLWVPIPHQCYLAMGTLRCVSSLLMLPLHFIFPITCGFSFHLPRVLFYFVPEQFPFFVDMYSTDLSFPLLPPHFLTQLLFRGHINLTFSSFSPMEFTTSYRLCKGNGKYNHCSLRREPECRSGDRALCGTGGFLFPVSVLLHAVHVRAHHLILFLQFNYKRSKQENVDLLRFELLMVKS